MLLHRPKAQAAKVLVLTHPVQTSNNSSVNSTTPVDDLKAYCEKFLKLADVALQSPARQPYRKAS